MDNIMEHIKSDKGLPSLNSKENKPYLTCKYKLDCDWCEKFYKPCDEYKKSKE